DVGDQFREQASDLADGQRDQARLTGGVSLAFTHGDDGQDGVREHDQGGVPVPRVPPSNLMLIEADGAFRVLETALHRPAGAGDAYQSGQSHALRAVAAVE